MSNELFHDVHSLAEDAYLAALEAARARKSEGRASFQPAPERGIPTSTPHTMYAHGGTVTEYNPFAYEDVSEWLAERVAAAASITKRIATLEAELAASDEPFAEDDVAYEEEPLPRNTCEGCGEAAIEGGIVRDVELLMRDEPAVITVVEPQGCGVCSAPDHLTAYCTDAFGGPVATAVRALARGQSTESGVYLTPMEVDALLEDVLECARWH